MVFSGIGLLSLESVRRYLEQTTTFILHAFKFVLVFVRRFYVFFKFKFLFFFASPQR